MTESMVERASSSAARADAATAMAHVVINKAIGMRPMAGFLRGPGCRSRSIPGYEGNARVAVEPGHSRPALAPHFDALDAGYELRIRTSAAAPAAPAAAPAPGRARRAAARRRSRSARWRFRRAP